MIEVAVRGVLDANGGHGSTAEGSGIRKEPRGDFNTTGWRSNNRRFDILGENM